MTIWQDDSDEYKLKKLKKSDIIAAEKLFGVKLPEEYINILKQQNGGEIIYDAFPTSFPTSWDDTSGYIDHILGIGEEGILETPYYIKEWEMPNNIILFSGDGHAWLAFDYRNTTENPAVIYIDNDSNQVLKVANSFKEFLDSLYIDESEDYVD